MGGSIPRAWYHPFSVVKFIIIVSAKGWLIEGTIKPSIILLIICVLKMLLICI